MAPLSKKLDLGCGHMAELLIIICLRPKTLPAQSLPEPSFTILQRTMPHNMFLFISNAFRSASIVIYQIRGNAGPEGLNVGCVDFLGRVKAGQYHSCWLVPDLSLGDNLSLTASNDL